MYERKDRLYRKAKAQGLRSRAAFKLESLDRNLLGSGHRVVDLGCWPGGWLQVASQRVGAAGRVVGVDTRPMTPLDLSNMSPSLSGVRDRDEAQASELVSRALAVAERLLRPGGSFVCKIFMNSDY